jgi:hypothetical protein
VEKEERESAQRANVRNKMRGKFLLLFPDDRVEKIRKERTYERERGEREKTVREYKREERQV